MLSDRNLAKLCILLSLAIGVFSSRTTGSWIPLLASAVLLPIAAVLLKTGNWVVPVFLGRLHLYPMFKDMQFREDCVVVRDENEFFATGFVRFKVISSIADLSKEERHIFLTSYNSLLMNISTPFEISQACIPLDISEEEKAIKEKIEYLKRMRGTARVSYPRGQPRAATEEIMGYSEDIDFWEDQLKRLRTERPMDIIFYITVSGSGPDPETAVARMRASRDAVARSVASSMGVIPETVKGTDLMKLVDMRFRLPVSARALGDLMF